MTYNQFKAESKAKLAAHLVAIQAGEINWTVSNQFNESYVESAIESIDRDARSVQDAYSKNLSREISAMDLAITMSTFDVEPIASAWIN